jgi:hypothetical protein
MGAPTRCPLRRVANVTILKMVAYIPHRQPSCYESAQREEPAVVLTDAFQWCTRVEIAQMAPTA